MTEVTETDVAFWYHAYSTEIHPTTAFTFNQGWGTSRFAPINQADGSSVHTYYVASTAHAVYLESVLHEVDLSAPGPFEVDRLEHWHLARLKLPSPLKYVSLHTPHLARLKVTRADLVDSLTDCYPQTREWSQAAFAQAPDAQAIGYGSRRHDAARCLMLFGQRMPASAPFQILADDCIGTNAALRRDILDLVRELGIPTI